MTIVELEAALARGEDVIDLGNEELEQLAAAHFRAVEYQPRPAEALDATQAGAVALDD